MDQPISQLMIIINSAISNLTKFCDENNVELPNLNSPSFTQDSEAFRTNDSAAEFAKLAAAACLHLATILVPPTDVVYQLVVGSHHSAAVKVCLEANVTEILRDAGSEGMHVNNLATKCGIDASKLARILRYLATHHCYREVEPDVFANNRVSSTLDTGKSIENLTADPSTKYESSAFPALCNLHLDIDAKCNVAARAEALKDAEYTQSGDELTKTVFGQAMNTSLSFWEFLALPEQQQRQRNFTRALQGFTAMQPADLIFKVLDWPSISPAAKVVDVGGGIGTTTTPLIKKYSGYTVVIQDLPHIVEEGKKLYMTEMYEEITRGKLQFQGYNFLNQQPIKDADVFVMKGILHNWPDSYNGIILRNLREAAMSSTKLIIIDYVIPYACQFSHETEDSFEEDVNVDAAPEPLLPNYGPLNDQVYTLDMDMMYYFNAQEHTILQFQQLLAGAGWRLTKCRAINTNISLLHYLVALPV
ncbi:S-adenosyl-L-methionine-dependent methyltransferase [Dendrothele bispora CBS 962.96]|uniref:S-adenosyl-L-methionine-dependent methyltransferase n=1 Tax=Dendrothele bispora (strain CBS 962.96) TaxID=1314807 RepID=A0A4S8L912_DENBC|nr:S-adenosyl-L-methionine-dependent methyltransferase [Dendrothele bispora CBS 962.96]